MTALYDRALRGALRVCRSSLVLALLVDRFSLVCFVLRHGFHGATGVTPQFHGSAENKHNQGETVHQQGQHQRTSADPQRLHEAVVVKEPSLPPRPQLRHEIGRSRVSQRVDTIEKASCGFRLTKKNVATSGSSKSSKTPSKKAVPTHAHQTH